ncbi:Alpha/Beta hydrolase protein [Chaetomium tenue]|uniref:Alpha/Beta hydrolase protein n=1 Tax=Chaetomium tenue TaxID=1854479 RepID=A0ACB7P1V0_9PEZI|nr:Alpha/Beta hydrolase protein [Chaetomium globosum]
MLLSYICTLVSALAGSALCNPTTARSSHSDDGLIDLGYAKHVPTYINTTASGQRVAVYKNIRFANPPTGNLRFRAPDTNLPHVDGVQDGKASPDLSCISSAPWFIPFPGLNGTTWGSEDCLFLDVYVPEGVKPGDDVPVLHNFHGSSYAFGNKEIFFYPMGLFDLAHKQNGGKFIAVANNYRMGVSGFTWAAGEDLDGNVGMLDCLAAAEWTAKYIHKFGGARNRITAIGQSAGAGILYYLSVLNTNHPLPFQQAFLSSPAAPQRRNVTTRQHQLFNLTLTTANCTTLTCLRSLPSPALLHLNDAMINQQPSEGGGGTLGPIIGFGLAPDGDRIPDIPLALLLQGGRVHKSLKRLVVGSMAGEGRETSSDEGMPGAFAGLVRRTLPGVGEEAVGELLRLYYTPGMERELAWDWTTDVVFACNGFALAGALEGRVRRYVMSTPPAVHGMDLLYYFHVDQEQTPVEYPELALAFQAKLLALVRGEDMEWPVYGADQHLYNITDSFEATELPDKFRERCELIQRLVLDPANGA